ncbi:MAG: Hsp20/alpha crystallin family protein [Methanomassiliicoccus sp.]|nr:Hsp20/alpha crystallin family protein [Methanomassiliicoccus sp.]
MSIKKKVSGLVPMGYWGTSSVIKEMERLVEDLKSGLNDMVPYGSSGNRIPAVDVLDEGDRYVVEAELPGAEKNEVSVEIAEDHLVIRTERTTETEEKEEGYYHQERERKSFYRQIPLPPDADTSQASAGLENGLLRVTMPKKDMSEGRRKLDIE